MNKYIPKLRDLEVRGKRVLVRVDFNVPLHKVEDHYEVSDATRITGALPTIQYLIDEGAKVILASHLGRPEGKPQQKYSLEPVGAKLSELLNEDVVLADDCVGDGPRSLSQQMRPGEVLLLENLRFHPGEEGNSTEFANDLLELCDIYVSDAFGTLHRAHASTYTAPKLAAVKAIGFLVEKELTYLEPLRESPKRPFALVMGGAKVSDKMGVIEHFLPKVDSIIIGGAMAYSFLKAQGTSIGKSLCDDKQVKLATQLLRSAGARNIKLLLPVDHVITTDIKSATNAKTTSDANIPDGWCGVDIGPKTLELYQKALNQAETIFWNGPMGVFEEPAFAKGTFGLAAAIAQTNAQKLVGGGDSVAAIAASGTEDQFDFISTGGGATLEYLEGKELPGLEAVLVPKRGESA